METQTVTVTAVHAGKKRIDQFLSEHFTEYSRAYFQRLIRQGHVRLQGIVCCSSKKVRQGDCVQVAFLDEYMGLDPEPAIVLQVLHEDDHIMVVNKPAGMVVHPGVGNKRGTLANALAAHVKDFTESLRPGIVHRLDKNTSGVMVVAKTMEAHRALGKQFTAHDVLKVYLAIVYGIPGNTESLIQLPIGRDPVHRQKMAVVSCGRKAETYCRIIETGDSCALLEVHPHTGRTHQIRVHLAHIGYPVVGDDTYGCGKNPILKKEIMAERQMLHAWKLSFIHPVTQKREEFCAPVPDDFRNVWTLLGKGKSNVL